MQSVFEAIHSSFASSRTFLVGGAVRDMLLGIQPKDKDYLVTGLRMDQLLNILNKFGIANLVGQSFGVIKFTYQGTTYDFALPRREISTGVGHDEFVVDSGPHITLEQDLLRRDFRCNAIVQNALTGEILDPLGGANDVKNKILRTTNSNSFLEDPLRILRGVQFAARFGFSPDSDTQISMACHAHLIPQGCSPERISAELCKLLKSNKPSVGFKLMQKTDVLKHVLPELDQQIGVPQPKKYHAYDVFDHSLAACDAMNAKGKNMIWMRLLALLHDVGKPKTLTYKDCGTPTFPSHDDVGAEIAKDILTRLRFSSVSDEMVPGIYMPIDNIVSLIKNHMFACDEESTPRIMRRFMAKVGRANIFPQIRLRIADRSAKGIPGIDVTEWVRFAKKLRTIRHGSKTAFSVKDLAINGNDIMSTLNMKPGKQIGIILNSLFEKVMDNPELNNRESLLDLIKSL